MKNKIILISFIFILVSCVFINNNVFASTDYTYNGETITLPDLPFDTDEYPNYGIYYHKDNGYTCFYARYDMDKAFITPNKESNGTINNRISYYQLGTTTKGTWYYYLLKDGAWGSRQHTDTGYMHWTQHVLYSSFDIYTDYTFTDFFFKAPVTLAMELEKIQVAEMWKTLMKNVVVSLVVFLVGFLAFSKAWAWLKTQLHKA